LRPRRSRASSQERRETSSPLTYVIGNRAIP
jgi:hypothetical protein